MKTRVLAVAMMSAAMTIGFGSVSALAEGEIEYKHVDAPEAINENGVVTADQWEEIYPEIIESFRANADNNYRISYLDEDPYLSNVYEGYGFAIDYTSAISHSYTLEDVNNTERPHPLANCLTCKTPDYTKLVNDMGEEAYSYDFAETLAQMNENISCYNCHENQAGDGGKLVVTHSYVTKALGDEMENISPAVLACGQCHIEYHFDPETKATTMPYSSVAEMDPTAILAHYNEMGFNDWTQESTGTGMLKAQHPEMETFLGEGSVHAQMLNCADCHMAKTTSDEGVTYHSHKWESPLENEELLASCVQCHGDTDMKEKVTAIQTEVVAREKEVGSELSNLKDTLAEAVAANSLDEKTLQQVRSLYRDAQWYWDFCYVENSEGAHNSAMAKRCLNNAETLINAAMARFA